MSLTKASFSIINGACINVLDYGAVADGTTNNYDAFVAAIAACSSLSVGRLVIPAGTYNLTQRVTVNVDLIIEGDGIGSTVIKSTGANTFWYPQANVVFRDMSLIQDVTDFNTYTSFSIELRAAKQLTVERVYMEGPSYDGIYVSNADANLRVIDCECNGFGRLALAVTNANDVYIDGFKGTSTEATKLFDGIDLEPNTSCQVNTAYFSRLNCTLSLWAANGPIHKTVIENCQLPVLGWKGNNNGTDVVDVIASTIDVINYPPSGNYFGGTINFIDDLQQPINYIPDSRLPGMNTDFWSQYYSPEIVDDYVVFDSEGTHGENSSIETADRIAATDGDLIVFGGIIKRISGAASNNSTGIVVSCYDSGGSVIATIPLTANASLTDAFYKQTAVFTCPENTASVGMFIGVGTTNPIAIGVKNAFLYKNVLNAKYVDGVIYQHLQASAAPSTGTHFKSEIVYNNAPASAGYIGWVCTAGGSPGTWNTFGAVT